MEPALGPSAHPRAVADGAPSLADDLEQRLGGYGVVLLADRALPSHGRVDRIAVGPGGITLIDTSSFDGPARIQSGRLLGAERDHTGAVDALLAQRRGLEALLDTTANDLPRIKAALCWPDIEGSAHFGSLSLKGVRVDDPRGIARLARRRGELPPEGVALIAGELDRALS